MNNQDDFDTAVARIHRRKFADFVLSQLVVGALLIGLAAIVWNWIGR